MGLDLQTQECEASSQDGGVGKCGTHLFPWPQKNYKETTEQPSVRTAWNLAEHMLYN